MTNKTINLLKKIYKNKYQNIYFNNFEIKKYFKKRKEKYSFFLKKKKFFQINDKKNLDNTSKFFLSLLKKKIKKNEEKNIFLYYKKYSAHLKLKSKYNKKLIKKSNKEMNLNGYIYFANLIQKIKKINKIQKLNILLKINDYTLINCKKIKTDYDKKIFIKNFETEKKLIINFLK